MKEIYKPTEHEKTNQKLDDLTITIENSLIEIDKTIDAGLYNINETLSAILNKLLEKE